MHGNHFLIAPPGTSVVGFQVVCQSVSFTSTGFSLLSLHKSGKVSSTSCSVNKASGQLKYEMFESMEAAEFNEPFNGVYTVNKMLLGGQGVFFQLLV